MQKAYYHAVMFDFDGTLVDTMHEYARIASKEMEDIYGIARETARQLYLETSGIPFFQLLDLIFEPDQRNDACAIRYENRKAVYLESVRMDRETKDTISQIRKAFQLAYQAPWVIPKFFRRFGHSLAYHVHRIRNGGSTRGIR